MKYILLILFSFSGIILMNSCEEVGPTIEFVVPLVDTSYVVQDIPNKQLKVVVVEDFSGVQCVNCPLGNSTVQQIIDVHPEQVIGLTVHGGDLAIPYNDSEHDFVSEETTELNGFLGVFGWPAAAFDRVQISGQQNVFVLGQFSSWLSFTEQRMAEEAIVNINIENNWSEDDRTVKTAIRMTYTESDSEQHKVSIFLVESHIIDPQLDVIGKISDYEHNHVVRDMFTIATGTSLSDQPVVAGLTVEKEFELLEIPELWNIDNCYVVAMVHRSGDSKEVLQGAQETIIP